MGKIIKITESQIREIVQKVINEQAIPQFGAGLKKIGDALAITNTNKPKGTLVDQIYQEFVAGGTGAQETSHTQMASAINKIPDYKTLLALNDKIKKETPARLTSLVQCLQTWLEVGEENIFKNIQAKLKTLGVNLVINNPSGIFRPKDIRIAKGGIVAPTPEQNKIKYRLCSGFPIKYGCKQTEVGYLQKCLGVKVDYSFGPDTLKAFLDLNPDPKMKVEVQKQIINIGLSEQAYNRVASKCIPKAKPKKTTQISTPKEEPFVDTRDKTQPLTIASRQIQQLPVNINLPTLQSIETPGISQERRNGILSKIKNRGFDKVYKGEPLTPEEKEWLQSYLGTEINKERKKSEQEKLRLPNP